MTHCVGGFPEDRQSLGPFPFGPEVDEPPVEGSVTPVMLVVEINLPHHRDAFVIISRCLQQNRCGRKRNSQNW